MSVTTVAEMLAVREWAIRTLVGEGSSAPSVQADGYRTVLERERCAIPIVARLGAAAPQAAQELARRHTQVVLAREGALAEVGRIGRERGVPVVALKTAAHRTPIPSLDLDVLVPEARLDELVQELARRGYRGQRGHLAGREVHQLHLPALGRAGEMMIEVHFNLGDGLPLDDRVWETLRPHPVHEGIRRLPPARHVWHLLWHSTVFHPDRRGQLGDLVLIAEALGDLDSPARAWLNDRIEAHPGAGALERALRMVEAIRGMTAPMDEFRAVAAAQYRLRTSSALSRLPARLAKQLEAQWFELVEGGSEAALWRQLVLTDGAPSARPWLHGVERTAPRLARSARVTVRAAVFMLSFPVARILSRLSERDAAAPTDTVK
jgi:acetolactate synthase regulatory subunit